MQLWLWLKCKWLCKGLAEIIGRRVSLWLKSRNTCDQSCKFWQDDPLTFFVSSSEFVLKVLHDRPLVLMKYLCIVFVVLLSVFLRFLLVVWVCLSGTYRFGWPFSNRYSMMLLQCPGSWYFEGYLAKFAVGFWFPLVLMFFLRFYDDYMKILRRSIADYVLRCLFLFSNV